jgi:RNA polymerase sigma factor (sigma-70 family)
VINDTLYVVWCRADSFRPTARASTWIFGIAYRRGLKALGDLDDPVEADCSELPDESPSAEDRMLNAEVHRLIDLALSQMSAEHRAVIELCYYHACPYREIAQITGCPVETVKTRSFTHGGACTTSWTGTRRTCRGRTRLRVLEFAASGSRGLDAVAAERHPEAGRAAQTRSPSARLCGVPRRTGAPALAGRALLQGHDD